MPEQQEQLSPQALRGAKVKAEFAPAVDAAAPDAHAADGAAAEQVPPGSKWKRLWKEQIRPLAVMLLVLFSVRSSIADWNVVPTGSMKPSIIEGDRILVNKLAYDLKFPFTTWHLAQWSDPKRGEVVVFDSPEDGTRLVKRVIGMPGDTIQLIKNNLYVNGQPAVYTPLDFNTQSQITPNEQRQYLFQYSKESVAGFSHPIILIPPYRYNPGAENDKRTWGPVTVPPGNYFMMGDNRDMSKDSRFIGFVPRGNIIGRSSAVLLSLNYDNYYMPRSQRWFRGLP